MKIICFSKDRPLQLTAYLESLFKHISISLNVEVDIIYTCSDNKFDIAYEQVKERFPWVAFYKESNNNINNLIMKSVLSSVDFIMLGCDDVIFTDSLHKNDHEQFLKNDQVFCFSYRLGKNITYCHPAGLKEEFVGTESNDYIFWNWMTSTGVDFRYPFELNATVYRREDVLKYLNLVRNLNLHPNIFEGNFYSQNIISQFYNKPYMAAHKQSHAYVITVNRVQDVADNVIYNEISTAEMLDMYNKNKRIDIDYYHKKVYNSIHIGEFVTYDVN